MRKYIIVISVGLSVILGTHLATKSVESEAETPPASIEATVEPTISAPTTSAVAIMTIEETTTEEVTTTAAEIITEKEIIYYYSVNGQMLDGKLYEYIRSMISSMGHPEWMPYILCQIYQESKFDIYAENQNGQDKGLLQFRLKYWDWSWGDIFDPYSQINEYLKRWKTYSNAGYDIYSIISSHYTGLINQYSEEYVNDVLKWMSTINEISIK